MFDMNIGVIQERDYIEDLISTLRHDLREYGTLPSCIANIHRLVHAERRVKELESASSALGVLKFTNEELKLSNDDLVKIHLKQSNEIQALKEDIKNLKDINKDLDRIIKMFNDRIRTDGVIEVAGEGLDRQRTSEGIEHSAPEVEGDRSHTELLERDKESG
jgi:hypothetical protein